MSERPVETGSVSDSAMESEGALVPAESGLLSFYDRLRVRIERTLARRGGKLGAGTAEALLLVPDVFMLLVRLSFDRTVPHDQRALIGGALIYFLVPVDLLPEGFIGPTGYLEDLVLASVVLAHAFGKGLAPYAERHWSGSRKLKEVLADISSSANALLGEDMWRRVQGALARRGINTAD